MTDSLPEYLANVLDLIDSVLVEAGVPLHDRPLQAALEFVRELVLEVSGGSLEDPIGQPWFDALHLEVHRWYHRRYGDAMSAGGERKGRAFVVFRGVPLALSVPLIVVRPDSNPGRRWLHFPETVREDEDPLAFLDSRLGITEFRDEDVARLRSSIVSVVSQTRALNVVLLTADLPDAARALSARILPTLNQAVHSAVAQDRQRHSLAAWELNLSAELAVKILIHQRGVSPPPIHDVARLVARAIELGLPRPPEALLARFPNARQAIQFRYGEVDPPSILYIDQLYGAVLDLANHVATHLTRVVRLNNAAILIRTIGALANEA